MPVKRNNRLVMGLAAGMLVLAALTVYSLWHYRGEPSAAAGSFGFRQGNQQHMGQAGGRTGGFTRPERSGAGEQGPDGTGQAPDSGDSSGQAGRAGGSPGSNSGNGTGSNLGGSSNGAPGAMGPSGGESGPRTNGFPRPGGGAGFAGAGGAALPYSAPLLWYSGAFAILSAAVYYAISRRKQQPGLQEPNREKACLLTLLGAGLLLRVAVAPWIPGHPGDMNFFRTWAASAAKSLSGFYANSSSDYPPLYILVLYPIGKLIGAGPFSSYTTLLIKLPSILADTATAYLLYRAARKRLSMEISLLLSGFYLFNPAIFINSTFWGQADSFFTLLIVGAVLLLASGRIGWSSALFAAAVLMKPQGIIFAPVLLFELVRTRRFKPWLIAAGSALAAAAVIVLPFTAGRSPSWLIGLYTGTINEYPYATVNAFNLFALLKGNFVQDQAKLLFFSYSTWGLIFIVLTTLFSWRMFARFNDSRAASVAALIQIAGVFTLSSSMHERYLFPAVALALLGFILLQDRRLVLLAAGFSITVFLNTYDILYHSMRGAASYSFILVFTSALNVLLCVYLAMAGKLKGKTPIIAREMNPG